MAVRQLNEQGAFLVDAQRHAGDRAAPCLDADAPAGQVVTGAEVGEYAIESVAHRVHVALFQREEEAGEQLTAVDGFA